MGLLDKYDKSLSTSEVSHLLRRMSFGATPDNIRTLTGSTADIIVTSFLAATNIPAPPKDQENKTFTDLPWGYPATETTELTKTDATRRALVKGWWVARMINQPVSIIEKITLFWQNHFVSTSTVVSDSRFIYTQYLLLRKHALGNFRTFVIEMTKDHAMLIYLNGNQNVVGKPNENYGRELQELFTIGRGNYTEDDVKNAARVLTGWRPNGYRSQTSAEITVDFKTSLHDTDDKIFSSNYQNTVIKGRKDATAGDTELGELVDMILRQDQTSLFIIRKIYRWFVQAEISDVIEREVIQPLATSFKKDYEIKPVLQRLFTSQHFFDIQLTGSQIKSPLDLIIGTLLHFNQTVPDPVTSRTAYDLFTQYILARAVEQQMSIFDQPTVFGWRPYYDTTFYELWINATTLALRGSFTDSIAAGNPKLKIDIGSLELVKKVSNPSDPVILINEFTESLFALNLTQSQKDYVIDEILIPGLPRYEWGIEWNKFVSDPTNIETKNAVKMKVDDVFLYLMRLAEYQMG